MYTAQFYPFREPRTLISSGGLGTMGFGLPAAVGAKVGSPDKEVVLIDGDGSFLMTIQELATAVRYKVGVVVLILNNHFLGMVRQWQEMFMDKRQAETDLQPPPYAKVAQAFGGLGREVTTSEELEEAIAWARAEAADKRVPVVLDVAVEREALVLPMVPSAEPTPTSFPVPARNARSRPMENLSPISVLVRNERGVLSRVSGLFARRGFNIYSLAVGETDDPTVSRISVVVAGDPR